MFEVSEINNATRTVKGARYASREAAVEGIVAFYAGELVCYEADGDDAGDFAIATKGGELKVFAVDKIKE